MILPTAASWSNNTWGWVVAGGPETTVPIGSYVLYEYKSDVRVESHGEAYAVTHEDDVVAVLE